MPDITESLLDSAKILRREIWLTDEFGRPYNVVGVKYLKASKRGKTILAYRLEVIVFADEIHSDGTFDIVRTKAKQGRSTIRDKHGNPSPSKSRPST